jgi:hypothetical protein
MSQEQDGKIDAEVEMIGGCKGFCLWVTSGALELFCPVDNAEDAAPLLVDDGCLGVFCGVHQLCKDSNDGRGDR